MEGGAGGPNIARSTSGVHSAPYQNNQRLEVERKSVSTSKRGGVGDRPSARETTDLLETPTRGPFNVPIPSGGVPCLCYLRPKRAGPSGQSGVN